MFQGAEAGDAVYWDVETQEESNDVRAIKYAKGSVWSTQCDKTTGKVGRGGND